MRKYWVAGIVVLFFCVVAVILLFPRSRREVMTTLPEPGSGYVTVYEVGVDTQREFICNPDIITLEKWYSIKAILSLELNDECSIHYDFTRATGEEESKSGKAGVMRIGVYPVYKQLIEFFGDVKTLESYISENGVDAKITGVILVNSTRPGFGGDVPMFAYLETDQGIFYISLDEEMEKNYDEIMATGYRGEYYMTFYSENDFIEKYGKLENQAALSAIKNVLLLHILSVWPSIILP